MKKWKFIVPNLFTALSLISALLALNYIASDEFILAPWLIALSMLFDFMDGKAARLLNATSPFGAQFDTLSDFVAFGVVPAALAYRISLRHIPYFGAIVAILFVLTGCYRLVRFSLRNSDFTKKQAFLGLPIPMGAAFISSAVLVSLQSWNRVPNNYVFLFTIIAVSLLMISRIEYLAIDREGKYVKEFRIIGIVFFLSVIFTFRYIHYTYFLWTCTYILFGVGRSILANRKQ